MAMVISPINTPAACRDRSMAQQENVVTPMPRCLPCLRRQPQRSRCRPAAGQCLRRWSVERRSIRLTCLCSPNADHRQADEEDGNLHESDYGLRSQPSQPGLGSHHKYEQAQQRNG